MAADEPKLLSGGNPQIAKGHGDEPVQAYIAAMPGWKRAVGEQLDSIIVAAVPDVEKAVKYNQPLYGMGDDHWFTSFRCFTKYVKVTFFRGDDLEPLPPGTFKQPGVRALDIYEADAIDVATMTSWMEQASRLPGERL